MDCRIRAVSVGNFHRTVPATMLSALAVAHALPGTIVAQQSQRARPASPLDAAANKTLTIRVGQPAGLSEATAVLDGQTGLPMSIQYLRTARRIMDGHVLVPSSKLHGMPTAST